MGRACRYICVVDKKFYLYNASHMRTHTRYYKSHVTSEHTTEWNCRFVWRIISITERSYSGKIFLGSTSPLSLPIHQRLAMRLRYKLLSSQCSDHWTTIIQQLPAHTILSICCRSGTECSSLTPGSLTPIRKFSPSEKKTMLRVVVFFHSKWLEASCFSWKYLCSTHESVCITWGLWYVT